MRLTGIAMQNLRRRKMRSALLVLSVMIGVASIIFLYTTTRAMKEDVANKLDQYGSNILILPDSGQALTFGGITVEAPTQVKDLNMSLIPLMKTIKNKETLATIAPELLDNTTVNDQAVLLLGVEFPQELHLKKWWKIDGLAPSQVPSAQEIILGSDVAHALNLSPKQTVTIKGQTFKVAGVIQPTGSAEDDQSVFMDLPTLQTLSGRPNAISLIEAAAFCYSCPIDAVAKQLTAVLPGTTVTALRSTLDARNETVSQFNLFAASVSLILLLASSLVITLTMKSSVEERTREIGILRAIGFRKRHILQIILTEAGILSALGGLIGYFLGMGSAMKFGSLLIKVQTQIPWQANLLGYALGGSLLIGFMASLYPAWKATDLDPISALRYL